MEPYLGEGLQAAHYADARLLATVTCLYLILILQSKEAYVQAYLQGEAMLVHQAHSMDCLLTLHIVMFAY